MPWIPELFSGPALERIFDRAAADARAAAPVPYFDGVRTGETEALVRSFAGEPELHHPIRGRVKGQRAFEQFMTETNAWLTTANAAFGPVERIGTPRRGIEETVLTLDGDHGRFDLPIAIAADRDDDARIVELRIYYGAWPLPGRPAHRPPLLQADPDLDAPDVVGEHQRALCERLAGAGGGIALEHCTITDDGRSCALEYNVVRRGPPELAPEAGLAVHVRDSAGKLAALRIYSGA